MDPRDASKIIDLPEDSERVEDVPEELKRALADGERPCGEGRYAWEWAQGEARGLPVSVYCAEPLCLQTGSCTGPRFVPHMIQVDNRDVPRKITVAEAVMASRVGAEKAREQTGRPDTRTPEQVANHIGLVWQKAKESVKGAKFR